MDEERLRSSALLGAGSMRFFSYWSSRSWKSLLQAWLQVLHLPPLPERVFLQPVHTVKRRNQKHRQLKRGRSSLPAALSSSSLLSEESLSSALLDFAAVFWMEAGGGTALYAPDETRSVLLKRKGVLRPEEPTGPDQVCFIFN